MQRPKHKPKSQTNKPKAEKKKCNLVETAVMQTKENTTKQDYQYYLQRNKKIDCNHEIRMDVCFNKEYSEDKIKRNS